MRPLMQALWGSTLAAVTLGGSAFAAPSTSPGARSILIRPGRSIGSPTTGRLVGGARLNDAPYLRVVPAYATHDVRWGLESLVGMIDRSARAVRRKYPDAVLSVGHLSRPGGGEVDRHVSHESGRDADIGFYIRSQTNRPLYADHFVSFNGEGTAASWPGAFFDDARNWLLVQSMLSDPHTHISHIFVATPLRARLLAYAQKIGAPPALRQRAAEVMAQPRGSLPHDDHFHIRISCPPEPQTLADRCIENPVVHVKAVHRPAGVRVTTQTHVPRPKSAPPPRVPTPAPAPTRAAPEPEPPPAILVASDPTAPVDDVDGPAAEEAP